MSSPVDITTFVGDAVRSPTRLRKQFRDHVVHGHHVRSARRVSEGTREIEGGMDHISVHCAMRSGEITGQGQVLPPRRPHTQVLRQMRFRQKVVISGDHRERFEGDAKVGVVNELIG